MATSGGIGDIICPISCFEDELEEWFGEQVSLIRMAGGESGLPLLLPLELVLVEVVVVVTSEGFEVFATLVEETTFEDEGPIIEDMLTNEDFSFDSLLGPFSIKLLTVNDVDLRLAFKIGFPVLIEDFLTDFSVFVLLFFVTV